ncbi:MAG: 3'(2'),5'-bisphosphate nucleotidase CysQ [Burkholderiales bacterium]|nr:3'(2'),5'-bisphosphate nucleotidase CysQ [Burkholderiales bacterium]
MNQARIAAAEPDVRLARDLALRAGALLLDLRARACGDDRLTGRELGDAGDAQANALLLAALAAERPDDRVLSEESTDDLRRLRASRVWIIDPLDGTREFREGRDDWAVHVALVAGGQVIAAAVSQPARGDVFDSMPPMGGADAGAAGAAGARRIVISRSRPPRFAQAVADAVDATLWPVGSAGAKALTVVRGEALAYVHDGGMNEWDAAAPVGVALARGLHVSDLRGEPIAFNQRDVVLHQGLVICRPELARTVLQITSAASRSG